MAKQIINIGSGQNEGDGGPIRVAFEKINSNFDELYAGTVQTLTLVGTTLSISGGNAVTLDDVFKDGLTADVTGSVFGDDSTALIDGVNSSINLDGTVKGSIIPDADITYDIGSATNRFRDLYLSGNTINLGNAVISATAGGGINLPAGTAIPGVNAIKWVPDSILDYGLGAVGAGFVDTPVIIDQATYLLAWAQGIDDPFVLPGRIGFVPTVYTPTMSAGDIVSIAITTPGDYDVNDQVMAPGIDSVNTDNMWALPAGTDINDWAALNTAITNAVAPYGVIDAGVGMVETTVTTLNAPYTPLTPIHWADPAPTTVGEALDRLAAALQVTLGGPIP